MSEKRDMNVLEFARKISMLSVDTPLANEFDVNFGQKKGRWWTSQREHITVWCLHYPTVGTKNFEHHPSDSTRRMYASFSRAETLLWLAEALGEEKSKISEVIEDIKDINNCRKACSQLRKKISFDRILELLEKVS